MKPTRSMSLIFLAMLLVLSACSLPLARPAATQDISAAYTAAVQTVSVQFTQEAMQRQIEAIQSATVAPPPSPTNTMAPANTIQPPATPFTLPSAVAGSTCDKAQFVADVTIPDNTLIEAGKGFTKTWRVQNTGTCTWTNAYQVVFFSGSQMGGVSGQALTGNVAPGQTIDISVNMTAPTTNGTYTGYWRLRNATGTQFSSFYVQIKVGDGSSSGGGTFAVTDVSYLVSGGCGGFQIVAYITVNGPGTVEFYWVFNGNDPVESTYGSTLKFTSANTKATKALDWYITASGTHYAQVFIKTPNNQAIGKAFVTCP